MKLMARTVALIGTVLVSVALAAPAGAATAGSGSVADESGLIAAGRLEVSSAQAPCLYAAYTLSQVEAKKVKISYLLKDGCEGHQVMTWSTQTDRFQTSSTRGVVKHRTWTCYTCHRIKRAVFLKDPNFGQTFQALTQSIGLTGIPAPAGYDQGKTWTS